MKYNLKSPLATYVGKVMQRSDPIVLSISRVPLWAILIIPFIIIIISVVGLTNYLAQVNSQRVVDDIAGQLLHEINARIETHIRSFLAIPELINRNNARLIETGLLDISDIDAVAEYLWAEIQVYETVTSIYFGNPDGGLVSGGREGADGSLYVMRTDNFVTGHLNKYAVDANGNLTDLLFTVPQFDSRTRPWYIGAVERADANWASPYVLSTGQDLAIASSLPVYNEAGDLLGVVSVDIFLSHIRSFLANLAIGESGQTFIIERSSGLLVTASSHTPAFITDDEGTSQRILAAESGNPVIREASQYIRDELAGFAAEQQEQDLVNLDAQAQYLLITPFSTNNGLDWLIITAIPEADFLGAIEAQTQVTISLTVVAVMVAILAGAGLTIVILRPISQLSKAATDLAKGDWSQTVPVGGVRETRLLGAAFNIMAAQLREVFTNLEERMVARTAELSVSEARYRAVVEDQTELICRASPDYHVLFHNVAYQRYFGKTQEEIIGQSFLPNIFDEDQARVGNALASINFEMPLVTIEHRVIRADGEIRWMQWINRGLFDVNGHLMEIQSVGRDITETKQFEARLQQALDREIELNQLKSQFITTVSHEFRTPMTIIMNSTEILHRYSDRLDKAKQEAHYAKIQAQINRMTNLLEDVLTISRNNLGKGTLQLEVVDIKTLAQSIVEEISASISSDIHINFTHSGDCTGRILDARLMRLIISNLVSNAAKYSISDSVISVILACHEDSIQFSVKDTGIGIPEIDQNNIFEPFYRANNVKTIAGTGLGLAIVKRSVEQHHGTITFISQEGSGTTFRVSIPNDIVSEGAIR